MTTKPNTPALRNTDHEAAILKIRATERKLRHKHRLSRPQVTQVYAALKELFHDKHQAPNFEQIAAKVTDAGRRQRDFLLEFLDMLVNTVKAA